MTTLHERRDATLIHVMPLSTDVTARLRNFHLTSQFSTRGGVITDLDGTAVHERDGRILVADTVTAGLKAVAGLGRPVVINTLRFPLNVIRTFGRAWSAITAKPVPLVSLNGSVIGNLTPTDVGETVFEEIAAFPLSASEIDEALRALGGLLRDGIDNVVLFHYPRDWRAGEMIWTPRSERVDALHAKYTSATAVRSMPLEELGETLHTDGTTMLSVLVDIPEDRRMAYQHANPNRFVTAHGIDKLSGAREAAARLDFDLAHSVGAGDTPMDNFLNGVGLALHVGPMSLDFRGVADTVRLTDPAELGVALFELAGMQSDEQQAAPNDAAGT